MAKSKSPAARIRITFEPDISLGPGKARLLEGIRDLGSIAAAGRRMGMSYKRAWLLVEQMNAAFKATNETMDELAGKSETFKSIYPKWKAYREMQASWFKVAELPLDNFTSGAVLAGGK